MSEIEKRIEALALVLVTDMEACKYSVGKEAAAYSALAAAEERGRLQGQFSPLGDNHHNAAACPHCGDLLTNAEERGRRAGIEEAADKAYTAAHEAAEEIWKLHGAMQEAPCYQAAIAGLRTIRKIELALAPRDSAPGLKLRSDPRFDPDDDIAPRDSGKVPGSINVAELFDPAGDEE